jgi:broad-specificity NMP kinase
VAELGIVGRVRSYDERTGIVEADFEYSKDRRIPLLVDTNCVVHPMFFHRLNIDMVSALRVYPFPDHQEYRELGYPFGA